MNDGISSCVFTFKSLFAGLFLVLKQTTATPSNLKTLVSYLTQAKELLYSILKNFKKKLPLYSDFLSDPAYRTKSSNLRHHADELLTSFHGLALSFDDLESTLTQAQTILLYSEKDHTGKILRETLNLQVGS